MSQLINPQDQIKKMPAGSAIYARAEFDESIISETVFLIREEPRAVKALGENPKIEIRAGIIQEKGVTLVAVILRIGGEYFETWWNYYQPDGHGQRSFSDMATQERIPILFFTPEMTRSLAVRNSLAPFFADALRRVQAMPEWSMKDFNAAREVVYAKYPTVTKLWNALQRVK